MPRISINNRIRPLPSEVLWEEALELLQTMQQKDLELDRHFAGDILMGLHQSEWGLGV